LKPQNIMIGAFGEVLVLDWGVAKLFPNTVADRNASESETLRLPARTQEHPEQADPDNTIHGTIIGTARYMSPEQERGEIKQLNERSDVYSLGAILYFLLTNRSPSAVRPREVNAKVSKAAEAVCLKAMSASSEDRYATAAELAADVAQLLNDEPVSAYRENWFEKVQRWVSKNRVLVLIVLAYLLMRIFFIFSARR
jgi:serine/threonine protein kinase